jgi:hypothetical protein
MPSPNVSDKPVKRPTGRDLPLQNPFKTPSKTLQVPPSPNPPARHCIPPLIGGDTVTSRVPALTVDRVGGGVSATEAANGVRAGYEPAEWIDPEDGNPNRRTARRVRGVRRVDPIAVLARSNPAKWTAVRVGAAHQLVRLWSLAQPPARSLAGGSGGGNGDRGAVARLHASTRLRIALQAVGDRWSGVVVGVAIEGHSLANVADSMRVREATVSDMLAEGLDRAADFFGRGRK